MAADMWSRTGAVTCLRGGSTLLGVIDTDTPCIFLMIGAFAKPVSMPGNAFTFLTFELSS
jgi:hypothetical protein